MALPVPGEAGGDQLPGSLGAGVLWRGDGAGGRHLLHLYLERDLQTLWLNVAGHLTRAGAGLVLSLLHVEVI